MQNVLASAIFARPPGGGRSGGVAPGLHGAHRRSRQRGGGDTPKCPALLWAFGLYVLMPSHPDPIHAPEAIVRAFRARTGLVIFWVEFALSLALLARTSGPLSDHRAT